MKWLITVQVETKFLWLLPLIKLIRIKFQERILKFGQWIPLILLDIIQIKKQVRFYLLLALIICHIRDDLAEHRQLVRKYQEQPL